MKNEKNNILSPTSSNGNQNNDVINITVNSYRRYLKCDQTLMHHLKCEFSFFFVKS